MAQRASPEEYWRSKMQTQISVDRSLPVQYSFPEIGANGVVILGLVAIVGLLGLFALLGTANKCRT